MWNSRNTGYIFNVNELPERCNLYVVGQFPMDLGDEFGILKEDEGNYNNYKHFKQTYIWLIVDHAFLMLFGMNK